MRINLLKIFVVVILLIYSVIYLPIFSSSTANFDTIISLRHKYFSIINKVVNLAKLNNVDNYTYLRTPFRVMRHFEDGYIYNLVGDVLGIDPDTNTIYFKCSNNKLYLFNIGSNNQTKQLRKIDLSVRLPSANGLIITTYTFNELNRNPEILNSNNTDSYSIIWKDKRILKQLEKDYNYNNNEFINNSDKDIMTITKI